MYDGLIVQIRQLQHWFKPNESDQFDPYEILEQAADAIEELLKAATAMHTWIFLNSADEQAAYDECGLSDEMNMILGYGGRIVVEQQKEE